MSIRIAALAATLFALPAFAHPVTMRAEDRIFAYDAQVAACNDPAVLGRIQSRFDHREARDWGTNLTIALIDSIRQIGFRSNGADFIPRRYCTARAFLSSGKPVAVSYSISEDGGISGWQGSSFLGFMTYATPGSFHLEWCVQGLDRHRTYAPDCTMTRP